MLVNRNRLQHNYYIIQGTLLLFLLIFAQQAQAEALGVGVEYGTGGTLGTGTSLSYHLNERFSFRYTDYVYKETEDKESIKATSTLKYRQEGSIDSQGTIVNFHPFKGRFYVAGGMYKSDILLKAAGTGVITAEDGTVTQGDLSVEVVYESHNPYVGVGWSRKYSENRGIGLRLELGFFDIDKPTLSYDISNITLVRGEAGATITDQQIQDLRDEIDSEQIPKIRKKTDDLDQHTVLDLTISYHF